ncbi:DEAD/DEAH box helicase [Aureimonas psammosilenae]|uniref:DEAD/DEAH box helicase n=1 Tax=Aureimonas psammosilenae TaxID=2495496 RepID=UPI0012604D11|nr:DEAD/DEAH box helicase [Aureimonas psammosilenae]
MLQSVTIAQSEVEAERLHPLRPIGAVAALLERRIAAAKGQVIIYVARNARRREDIAELLRSLAGAHRVAEFHALDGLPGDGIAPGAGSMGRRMSTLRWLCDEKKRPAVVLTTAAALIRRVPPRTVWRNAHLEFRVGEMFDQKAAEAVLKRIGYRQDERVDEAGEWAVRGRVVEIFPAAAPRPCRIELVKGRISAIRSFDPSTQRSVASSEHLIVDPASEFLTGNADGEATAVPLSEASLHQHYGALDTLFDYLPAAELIVEEKNHDATDEIFGVLEEARRNRNAAAKHDYLDRSEWSSLAGGYLSAVVEEGDEPAGVPVFAREDDPFAAFADFVAPLLKKKYRVVIAGGQTSELSRVARRAGRALGVELREASKWGEVRDAPARSLLAFKAPIAEGFLAPEDRIVVVSVRDLAGQRAGLGASRETALASATDEVFRLGDAVVHLDHGVAILEGLEALPEASSGAGYHTEALRLRYAGDDTLLVPLSDIGALWRYGGAASELKLDRLKGTAWEKRRAGVVKAVSATAESMVDLLRAKEAARAPALTPDRVKFERFCARFPFELTPDQASATSAVLADLESGRPMDRLVCGDVGFGKTEVALRAAAAAVFAGRQVAVVAPTTVLAQQHFLSFAKRFERQGIEVVRLSRLASAAEAEEARQALADGSARIVVGSHALLSDKLRFKELGLVVIDEEQRFGSAQKKTLRELAKDIHVLAMTATPIPRTLQAAFVGLHKISVVATPPGRRLPVRTVVGAFDEEMVRDALAAEKARGGQSFVVCPRIEDLEPMAERLCALVPDLSVTVLHGKMKGEEMDEAMLAFAEGQGDVLLATSIVESGLDVPNANTMVVWRADLFGLSQLHQLRGRVGRGMRRATAFLVTDPDGEPTPGALERLETLKANGGLGAGFAIAARDLDIRGTGELLGEEQAGHLQVAGLALYRRMLERALLVAQGQTPPEEWRPDLHLGAPGFVPEDYVPEADLRIEIAIRVERIEDMNGLEALRGEVRDRFGPLPASVKTIFATAFLRLRCRELGIRRLDAGSKGIAATFSPEKAKALSEKLEKDKEMRWAKHRLVLDFPSETGAERRVAIETLLDRVEIGS